MTVKEAKQTLSGPLVFGDPEQMKARQFLEEVQFAIEAKKNCQCTQGDCPACKRSGCVECDECGQETECEDCDGSGDGNLCACLERFSAEVQAAALEN